MLEFVAGVVLGAIFSPFWVKLYNVGKEKITAFMGSTPPKE